MFKEHPWVFDNHILDDEIQGLGIFCTDLLCCLSIELFSNNRINLAIRHLILSRVCQKTTQIGVG